MFLKPEPNEKKVTDIIKHNNKEWGYCDDVIYKRCLEDVRNKKLNEIDEAFVKGPIRVFLINWGMMVRVLNRDKNWCGTLSNVLIHNSQALERFRDMSLESQTIEGLRDDIEHIYSSVRKIVGPTSASKLLHLICPNFFPMWDFNIRKGVGSELGKRSGLNCEAKGYYSFIKEVKKFLQQYEGPLKSLQATTKKPKLRLVDQYLWTVANTAASM